MPHNNCSSTASSYHDIATVDTSDLFESLHNGDPVNHSTHIGHVFSLRSDNGIASLGSTGHQSSIHTNEQNMTTTDHHVYQRVTTNTVESNANNQPTTENGIHDTLAYESIFSSLSKPVIIPDLKIKSLVPSLDKQSPAVGNGAELARDQNLTQGPAIAAVKCRPSRQSSISSKTSISSTSSFLSRLQRTKFTSLSKTNLSILRPESSLSFSIPIRRSTEPISNEKPQRFSYQSRGERSRSYSFDQDKQTSTRQAPLYDRSPAIYPALLSQVAEALRESVTVGTKVKDGIEYQNAFDGREAVDKLAFFIRTTDRNLAILLGRALDAQKFFHNVNYEHRLRDSVKEFYQFREHVDVRSPGLMSEHNSTEPETRNDASEAKKPDPRDLPCGVFTVLTNCYSPTCSRSRPCYSVSCPRRRLGQKAKSSSSLQLLQQRTESRSSLNEIQEQRLWIHTVPKDIADKLSKEETKRQETIFELIYTEKDFVDDLDYMKQYWIGALRKSHIIEPERVEEFIHQVFWNLDEVYDVNSQFLNALLQRQSISAVVTHIGDIILEFATKFEPYVRYGAHQIIGKCVFESEKTNPAFANFVQMTERLPQSRKLELNGYLTKPTTRLGRYNLLLREILRNTPQDSLDQALLTQAMTIISSFLERVNQETGKTESRYNLQLLEQRLLYNAPDDIMGLDLTMEHRKLLLKGTFRKKGSGSESFNVLLFLLDHYLVITKQKFVQHTERYKLHRKPIPLQLLFVSQPDQSTKRSSSIIPYSRPSKDSFTSLASIDSYPSGNSSVQCTTSNAKAGYPLCFVHLGRHGANPITLYAPTLTVRRQWTDKIHHQQQLLMQNKVFDMVTVNDRFFNSGHKVRCAATFDNGKSLVFGSDQGVYVKRYGNNNDELACILEMDKVSQLHVFEDTRRLMLVLANRVLYTYSLDALLSTDPNSSNRRGRLISNNVTFFKVGSIQEKVRVSGATAVVEKMLVCIVRQNSINSTIRTLELQESAVDSRKHKHNLGRLVRGSNETLGIYKDLYIQGIASSIQYFNNLIYVGSAKGFQKLDLASAEIQNVLDPNDAKHNKIPHKDNLKPISLFHHQNGHILLCYNEVGFYVDEKGRRVRDNLMLHWEGNPTAFAFRFPYIIAFDAAFIEVRHADTGALVQILRGNNIRSLKLDNSIHCVMDSPTTGSELIFELEAISNSLHKNDDGKQTTS